MTEHEKLQLSAYTLGLSSSLIFEMKKKLQELLPKDDDFLREVEIKNKHINKSVEDLYYKEFNYE